MKIETVGVDSEYSQGEQDALATLIEVALDARAATCAAIGTTEDGDLEGKSFLVFKVDHKWATVVLRVDAAEIVPGVLR